MAFFKLLIFLGNSIGEDFPKSGLHSLKTLCRKHSGSPSSAVERIAYLPPQNMLRKVMTFPPNGLGQRKEVLRDRRHEPCPEEERQRRALSRDCGSPRTEGQVIGDEVDAHHR